MTASARLQASFSLVQSPAGQPLEKQALTAALRFVPKLLGAAVKAPAAGWNVGRGLYGVARGTRDIYAGGLGKILRAAPMPVQGGAAKVVGGLGRLMGGKYLSTPGNLGPAQGAMARVGQRFSQQVPQMQWARQAQKNLASKQRAQGAWQARQAGAATPTPVAGAAAPAATPPKWGMSSPGLFGGNKYMKLFNMANIGSGVGFAGLTADRKRELQAAGDMGAATAAKHFYEMPAWKRLAMGWATPEMMMAQLSQKNPGVANNFAYLQSLNRSPSTFDMAKQIFSPTYYQ